MQCVYDDFPASSYAAYIGETPFSMMSFLTNGCLYPNIDKRSILRLSMIRTKVAAVIVAHPGSAAGLSGAMLRGTIWNR